MIASIETGLNLINLQPEGFSSKGERNRGGKAGSKVPAAYKHPVTALRRRMNKFLLLSSLDAVFCN